MKKTFATITILSMIFITTACQQNLTARHTLEEVLPLIELFLNDPVSHDTALPLFEGTNITYNIDGIEIEDLSLLKSPIYDSYLPIEIKIYAQDETLTIQQEIYVLSDYSPKHNYEIHLSEVDFENISKETYSPSIISLYQEDTIIFEKEGQVRGRGNSNWFSYEKKSYRISFSEDIEMMGLRAHHDYLLIGMHADKSLMRDALAHQLSILMELEITQDTRYVELYVNDNYHGLYTLIEDRTYIKTGEDSLSFALELDHRIYWDQTGELHIRIDGAPYGIKRSLDLEPDTLSGIQSYLDAVLQDLKNGVIHPDIDVTNWVKYMFIQELFKNVDAWGLSVFIYRDQEGSLKFGPVWDFDFALGNADYVGDVYYEPEGFFLAFDPRMTWFYHAFQIFDFKLAFKNEIITYYQDILPSYLTLIEVLGESLIPYSENNFNRWDVFNTPLWPNPMFMVEFETHMDHVLWISDFIFERSKWYQQAMFKQPFI
ncbi:MAG: CotH kinase family protein [Firmicutes bacterium]|nr:CotH kinase family protein [Bacillota bacterium]